MEARNDVLSEAQVAETAEGSMERAKADFRSLLAEILAKSRHEPVRGANVVTSDKGSAAAA